jgi:REP element-mobilizing transposase RayT
MNEENKPNRKRVRLKYFDYSKNGAYFITICTKDKKCILSRIVSSEDFNNRTKVSCQTVGDGALDVPLSRDGFMPEVMLTEIGKIVEKYILSTNRIEGVNVDRYVIMPNHIHMLISVQKNFVCSGTSRAPSPTEFGEDIRFALMDSRDPANEIIPRAVRALKRLTNAEVGEDIFQRSYYDHVIRSADDYNETVKYIVYNPRRWYLKNKVKREEVDYNEQDHHL